MNLNDRYSHVYNKEEEDIDIINNIGKGGFNFRKDYSFNFYSSIGKEIVMFRDYNSINRYRFYSTSNKNMNMNMSFNINESESENVNMNKLTNINNKNIMSKCLEDILQLFYYSRVLFHHSQRQELHIFSAKLLQE